MPKYVLKDAFIAVNGTAVSNLGSSCEIEDSADEVDFTGFGPAGYKEIGQGLKDGTVTVTFFSDFAAAGVNAGINNILQPLYQSGGTFGLEVRPTSAIASSTNPKMTATVRLMSYSGISGQVGDASTFDAAFRNAGTAGFVWGTV